MNSSRKSCMVLRVSVSVLAVASAATAAFAQDSRSIPPAPEAAAAESGVADIIVTAQKRSENINRVGMSISAASALRMKDLGVTDTRDLAKLVTGFTYTETTAASPVYSIRGVGYYETSLAATPAVSVYVDQIPLSYPQMTRNAAFDLERVEVLKGPQGTLFGQNATGGAVNYIAAKPTDTLQAGFEVTGGRFEQADAQAYVSGPINSTLKARIAIGHEYRGDWQQSYTRPGDTRGKKDISKARLLIDWSPVDRLNVELGGSIWVDHSDTLGAQLIAKTPNLPPVAAFITYPLAPANARAADWSPDFPKGRDDRFYQVSANIGYQITDDVKLTSITSYADLRSYAAYDGDATSLAILNNDTRGRIKSFNQEVRLSGDQPALRWVVGGNYARDHIIQYDVFRLSQASTAINNYPPFLLPASIAIPTDQKAETSAAFANAEYDITDKLTLQGGIRYTHSRRSFFGCIADSGAGDLSVAWAFLLNNVFRPSVGQPSNISIAPGACTTVDDNFSIKDAVGTLKENNVSWRTGLNYKLDPTTLLYVNISKGYKAGTFPSLGGVKVQSYDPTRQESLLAYEAGFKFGLFNRKIQLNGAAFYYDYRNKQILGKIPDPIFGTLGKLLNVPKSRVYGAELQISANPFPGFQLNTGITYLNSKVTQDFLNFSTYGNVANYRGYGFPYTPKWQATADAQYSFAVSGSTNAFVGGSVLYNDKTVGFFAADIPYNPADLIHRNRAGVNPALPISSGGLNIDAYALLDVRAGFTAADGSWKFTMWGRNVTNKYYWTNAVFVPSDSTTRQPGMPVTYGATFSFRY